MGKLRLHKLCRNEHFGTTGTITPNSKRKTFSCSISIILFNHKLGLSKYVLVFPCHRLFPGSSVALWTCHKSHLFNHNPYGVKNLQRTTYFGKWSNPHNYSVFHFILVHLFYGHTKKTVSRYIVGLGARPVALLCFTLLEISNVALLKSTQFPWHSLSAILKLVFRYEIRRQISVYFET